MATLYNTKISATYEGLLKTIDNAAITATLKELTDGSGNQSGLYLNTAGDFKVTSILEWGSLKDTGTGVTITQFVTSTDGIENFDNNTTLPTSAAVKLYVDTKFSQTDTLQEVLGFGNTTSGTDIAVSAGDDITFTDSSKIILGTSSEFEIFQDIADSRITTLSNLYIQTPQFRLQKVGGEQMITAISDAQVELYYNNSKRLETTIDGSKVTGNLVVTGTITGSGGTFLPLAGGTMTGNIVLNDNVKTSYGTSADFEIFHNASTNSNFIQSNLSRQLILAQDNIFIGNQAASESMITAIADAAVSLFYDNSKKFETTNTGATVTGALTTTTDISVGANATFVDGGKALFGASQDLSIYFDGANNYIQSSGGTVYHTYTNQWRLIKNGTSEFSIQALVDAQVDLYYNGTKRFETTNAGAKVTGNLEVTGTITGAGGSFLPLIGGTMTGDTIHNDNVKSIYGTASDGLEIYHDGTNSYVSDTGTGNLRIRATNLRLESASLIHNYLIATESAGVQIFFNDVEKFKTTNTGISVTGNGVYTGNVHVQDAGQLQLGTGINGKIYHDGNNFIANNLTGGLYIDQAAVTESIVFRTSDANALDVTALTINRSGDLITGRDVTIAGDLTVNGTTTTVNSQTLSVDDPLISLAINNSANSLDIGYYGKYNDGTTRYLGLFNDASDSNKFKLFKGTTVEPTTTVNIGGAGYVAADLVVAGLEATTGLFSGTVTSNSTTAFTVQTVGNIGNTAGDINIYSTTAGHNGLRMHVSGILPTDNTGTIIDNDANLGEPSYRFKDLYLSNSITSGGGATFAGNVNVNGTIIGSDTTFGSPYRTFAFGSNANGFNRIFGTTDATDGIYINAATGRGINFRVNGGGSNALEIDSSANATFAGNVTLNEDLNFSTNGFADISNTGTGSIRFKPTSQTLALTLTGANATFAGNVALENFISIDAAATGSPYIDFKQNGTQKGYIQYNDGAEALSFQSDNAFVFIGGATERMRIDGAGLATFAGDVTANGVYSSGQSAIIYKAQRNGGAVASDWSYDDATTDMSLGTSTGHSFSLKTGNIRALTLDTSQNATFSGQVGVGGTPTAGYNLDSVQDVGGYSIVGRHSSGGKVGIYNSTGDNGIGTINNYPMNFFTNNSGPQVTLTTSGNVGIGTTTPSAKLEVDGDTKLGGGLLQVSTDSTFLANYTYTFRDAVGINNPNSISAATGTTVMSIGSMSNGTSLITTGNVGIGTTSPDTLLHVGEGSGATVDTAYQIVAEGSGISGIQILSGTTQSGRLVFGDSDNNDVGIIKYDHSDNSLQTIVNAAERMRITSAGVIGIGDLAPTLATRLVIAAPSGTGNVCDIRTGTTANTNIGAIVFRNSASAYCGQITVNGATAVTNYVSASDYRLKEDLQDFKGLEMVSKIPVYDYKIKNTDARNYGVMAHELQEVLPYAVTGEKDAEEMQGVDYSKIVPLLVKSIQEQQVMLKELKAEIEILKAK